MRFDIVAKFLQLLTDMLLLGTQRLAWPLVLDEERPAAGDEEHHVGVAGLAGGGELDAGDAEPGADGVARRLLDFTFKDAAHVNASPRVAERVVS